LQSVLGAQPSDQLSRRPQSLVLAFEVAQDTMTEGQLD
jgi:hypothetical protein